MVWSHLDTLLAMLPAMELGLGNPNIDGMAVLAETSLDSLFAPRIIRDKPAALACLSGLHLLVNDVNGAHHIAQNLATPEGSFWHAIVHRRDGDFWNAKYWIRKVGPHPVLMELGPAIQNCIPEHVDAPRWIHDGHWDANGFVDLVENATSTNSDMKTLCQLMQQAEWKMLFDFCFAEACSQV